MVYVTMSENRLIFIKTKLLLMQHHSEWEESTKCLCDGGYYRQKTVLTLFTYFPFKVKDQRNQERNYANK